MLKNAECAAIIQVIGAGSGRTFDLAQARYGKVIVMSDADVDGAHIRCLLLTLVHRYMRPLLEEGRVYAAVPPLHRFEITNPGTKKNDVVYTYSEDEYRALLARPHRQGPVVQDAAALQGPRRDGRLAAARDHDGPGLAHAAPHHRLGEADAALEVFDLLMGTDVAPRKEFIVEGAPSLDRARIDA